MSLTGFKKQINKANQVEFFYTTNSIVLYTVLPFQVNQWKSRQRKGHRIRRRLCRNGESHWRNHCLASLMSISFSGLMCAKVFSMNYWIRSPNFSNPIRHIERNSWRWMRYIKWPASRIRKRSIPSRRISCRRSLPNTAKNWNRQLSVNSWFNYLMNIDWRWAIIGVCWLPMGVYYRSLSYLSLCRSVGRWDISVLHWHCSL